MSSEEFRDSSVSVVESCLWSARDGRVNSRELDDATRALHKMHSENRLLNNENKTLQEKNEQLSLHAEQVERESLGMKEQGPQAARDEVCAQLHAENRKLKQALLASNSEQMEMGRCQDQDSDKEDPFVNMLRHYLPNVNSGSASYDNSRSVPSSGYGGLPQSVPRSVSSPSTQCNRIQETFIDPDMRTLLDNTSATVQSRRRNSRHHSDSYDLVINAGATAQRRRSVSGGQFRRCSSASSASRRSSRDSFGLEKFLAVLNDNSAEYEGCSRLSSLIVQVLIISRRPVEAATLKKMLNDSTTRTRVEFFLRCTVVDHLVSKLQSPDSAQLFGNICPSLVESSSQFLKKLNMQHPVAKQRHSCPTFFVNELKT